MSISVMFISLFVHMIKWYSFVFIRVENLRKGAEPVNNADIIDMIQTNIFEDIGCGEYLGGHCIILRNVSGSVRKN